MDKQAFGHVLSTVCDITTQIAAKYAVEVDVQARFPCEVLEGLREAQVLSAGVPEELGGAGCTMSQLAELCSTLSQGCSASGMILAMHLIQVGCLVRHGSERDVFRNYLAELVRKQFLLASVTSEVGTFGEMRSSICAVKSSGSDFVLQKEATTVSYGAYADALLVTARRAPDAASGDQILVLLQRGDYELTQESSWDPMGMRGTCSPGGTLRAKAPATQILSGSFADLAAQTMVPYAHILWASLWWGIAADAMKRASSFVRAQARKSPGVIPPAAGALAKAMADLQYMRLYWLSSARDFDAPEVTRDTLMSMEWAIKMNNLKIKASETAPLIVHQALQIMGMSGYRNDSKFSVGRHYRDSLSAALMVSNQRMATQQAAMCLVFKDHL